MAGGADGPEAVAGAEGFGGGMLEELAGTLDADDVGLVAAAHLGCREGLPDEGGGRGEDYGGQAELWGGVGGGQFLSRLEVGEHGGNLLVGADHADCVAGEDAGVARGDGNCLGPALDHHYVDAVAAAEVAVGEALADEGAGVADVDVGQVEVADEVVMLSGTAQVALVEVVDELRLDFPKAAVEVLGEGHEKEEEASEADEEPDAEGIG